MSLSPLFQPPEFQPPEFQPLDLDTTNATSSAASLAPRPAAQPAPAPTRASTGVAAAYEQKLRYLLEVWNEMGFIPGEVRDDVASQLGIHPEHLARMFRQYRTNGYVTPRPGSTKKVRLLDEHKAKVTYFRHFGVVTETYKTMKARGDIPNGMSVQTFRRRVAEWHPAIRACAKGGVSAMAKHQMFNDDYIPHKGYAYGTDHTQLPIRVIPPRSTKPVFPWLSILIDFYTRVILAFTLTLDTPDATDDLNLMLEGIRGWRTKDGMFVGGKPLFIRTDRGGDYISDLVSSNLIDLNVERQFTEPYSSHQNGRTEAVHRTLKTKFAPDNPGFHGGGNGSYSRRVFKIPVQTSSLTTLERIDTRFTDWVGEYNNEVHSKLGGLTPLEAWAEDPHVVERANADDIRLMMPVRETRVLHKYGIESRKRIFQGARLGRLRKDGVGQVQVKFHEHDHDLIEVFVDGAYQCSVVRTAKQSLEDRFGILSRRRAERLEAERLIRAADYERVVVERERLLEEGVDEAEWPLLPPAPDETDEAVDAFSPDMERALDAAAERTTDWERDNDEDEPSPFERFEARHNRAKASKESENGAA